MLSIIFCVAFVQSCKKGYKNEQPKSNEELVKLYSKVGEAHNKGMDAVFQRLKEFKKENGSFRTTYYNDEEVVGVIQETISDFIITEYSYTNDIYGEAGVDSVDYFNRIVMRNSDPSIVWDTVNSIFNFQASQKLRDFSQEIKTKLSETYSYDSTYRKTILEGLMYSYISTMDSEYEKSIIISMTSVAVSSSNYWNQYYSSWENLMNEYMSGRKNGIKISKKVDPRDVVMDDVIGAGVGAVSGAVKGAIGGTLAVPGIGTVTGAACCGLVGMVGGAIGNSVKSAFWSSVKSWFLD